MSLALSLSFSLSLVKMSCWTLETESKHSSSLLLGKVGLESKSCMGLLFWPVLSLHWTKLILALLAQLTNPQCQWTVSSVHASEFTPPLTRSPSSRDLSRVNPQFASTTLHPIIKSHIWSGCFLLLEWRTSPLISMRLSSSSPEYFLPSMSSWSSTINMLHFFLPLCVGSVSA